MLVVSINGSTPTRPTDHKLITTDSSCYTLIQVDRTLSSYQSSTVPTIVSAKSWENTVARESAMYAYVT